MALLIVILVVAFICVFFYPSKTLFIVLRFAEFWFLKRWYVYRFFKHLKKPLYLFVGLVYLILVILSILSIFYAKQFAEGITQTLNSI